MGAVNIKIDDSDVRQMLDETADRISYREQAMETIGEMVISSIQQNFEEQGRPDKWAELAGATIKHRIRMNKWPGKILQVGGELKKLFKVADNESVTIHTNPVIKYAAIHHFGGMAGRGKKVRVPARPFMLIQPEDEEQAVKILSRHILGE